MRNTADRVMPFSTEYTRNMAAAVFRDIFPMAEDRRHTRAKVATISTRVPVRLPIKSPRSRALSATNHALNPVTTRAMAIQAYTSFMRPGILMEILFSRSAVNSSYMERLPSERNDLSA